MLLVTNFQKSPSAGSSPLQASFNLCFLWPEVAWFGPIMDLQSDYDKFEL